MDLNIIKKYDCEGLILDDIILAYDEVELAIVDKKSHVRFRIDDIHKLVKALKQIETNMLENYKSMNLVEKNDYCKKYDIPYSKLQQIITLRSENDGKE